MKKRIFVDMDGCLAEWKEAEHPDVLYEEGYYLNLLPNNNMLNMIKTKIKEGEDVYILSSYLVDSRFALLEKNKWLNRYLPELNSDKRIFVKNGDDKSKYIKTGIKKSDYLIDDLTVNLIKWTTAGGTGIKFLNGINHTKRTWQGFLIGGDSYTLNNQLNGILNGNKNLFNKTYLDLYQKLQSLMKLYQIENSKNSRARNSFLLKQLNDSINDLQNKIEIEKAKIIEQYQFEILNTRYTDNMENIWINYNIKDLKGKILHSGYHISEVYEETNYMISSSDIIDDLIETNLNKIDVKEISPILKRLVDNILCSDNDLNKYYNKNDILESFDVEEGELINIIKDLETEIEALNLTYYFNILYLDCEKKQFAELEMNRDLPEAFDFSNENNLKLTGMRLNFKFNNTNVKCKIKLTTEQISNLKAKLAIKPKAFINHLNSYDQEKDINDDMF